MPEQIKICNLSEEFLNLNKLTLVVMREINAFEVSRNFLAIRNDPYDYQGDRV